MLKEEMTKKIQVCQEKWKEQLNTVIKTTQKTKKSLYSHYIHTCNMA